MWKEWKTEWIKVRYRGIGLILLAFAGLLILWSIWALDKLSQKQLDDGYRILFLQIPLLDTVLLPARPEHMHISSTMVREMLRYQQRLEPPL